MKEAYASYTPSATVELPRAPRTLSPVPWLTSIHSAVVRGPYGDARYPGNCSGKIIRDLLLFFQPKNVLDPMTGSGTCRDVCRELGIPCFSGDIITGFDACDPDCYPAGHFDFIWLHPPYWRMKNYGPDPRCLSNCPTAEAFYRRLRLLLQNGKQKLSEGGKPAVLIGDYFDVQEHRMIPCTHMTKDICLNIGLWPACTDIIRFQHNNASSQKSYARSFIPGLHDTCLVMEKRCERAPEPEGDGAG